MRKNVASQVVAAQMNSRTDGSPLTTGVSVFVTVDGGAQGAGGGTAVHEGNGHWSYLPTQAETNGNHVAFTFVHATGVNQTVNVYPVAFDPSDAAGLGLSRLDAAVSTRATPAQVATELATYDGPTFAELDARTDAIEAAIAAVQADTDNLQTRIPAALVGGRIDASVGSYPGNTAQTGDAFARLGAPAGASVSADIADVEGKVDDLETRLGVPANLGSGATVAANLSDIESQTDDIGVAGAGLTAVGDARLANLDATVSSRASQASLTTVDDFLDTEIAAIVAAVADIQSRLPAALVGGRMDSNVQAMLNGVITAAKFALDAIDAAALAPDATAEIADRLLGRSIQGGADGGRTVTSALRRVRNRNAVAAGVLTTYAEDDSTPDHTAVVTTAAGNPISEVDPA